MSNEKQLFELQKGEMKFKIKKMDNLNIRLEAAYDGKQADAGFFIELTTDEYLEMLKELIPGKVDDVLIEAIKQGL